MLRLGGRIRYRSRHERDDHPNSGQTDRSYVTSEEFKDLVARVDVHEVRIDTQEKTAEHLGDRISSIVRGGDAEEDVWPL